MGQGIPPHSDLTKEITGIFSLLFGHLLTVLISIQNLCSCLKGCRFGGFMMEIVLSNNGFNGMWIWSYWTSD